MDWGAHTASQNHCKPLCRVRHGWALGHTRTPKPAQNPFICTETSGFRGAHRIAKPLYPVRNGFWGTPRTPTPSQNPFISTDTGGFWGARRIAEPFLRSEIGGFWGTPHAPKPSQNPFIRSGLQTERSRTVPSPQYQCSAMIAGKHVLGSWQGANHLQTRASEQMTSLKCRGGGAKPYRSGGSFRMQRALRMPRETSHSQTREQGKFLHRWFPIKPTVLLETRGVGNSTPVLSSL